MNDDVPNCACYCDCCLLMFCVLVLLLTLCLLCIELHVVVGIYTVFLYIFGLFCYNTNNWGQDI